ncbi:hypothetical protein ACFOKI_07675 [Sphingomonas qilianensis]|uniref:Helix-turn-helix domain-containing protein n=1 Tax=Sphingomonas qilianensis TaxID=1736690 RepID=A0ABU9XSP3_9SPHN
MLYHCGLLDERPEKSTTLQWIKRPRVWGRLPPEIERELRIFLAMPGFSDSFYAHVFRCSRSVATREAGGYEPWKAEVAENWLSATSEDCAALSRMRPGTGNVPVISQLRAIQDVKAGMTMAQVGRDYRVSAVSVTGWCHGGVNFRGDLPAGFSLLGA